MRWLAASTIVMVLACDQPVAPHAPKLREPGRPAFNHDPGAFALAFQSCGSDSCFIGVSHGDGTSTFYSNSSSYVLHPTWSPDASKLAADDGGDIVVLTLSDGNVVTLTSDPAIDRSPAWSPDGARIAFVSSRSGEQALYVMRASDGGGVTRLTSGVTVLGKPTWSPDGTRLAFTCGTDGGPTDVCAIDADGSGFARLTTTGVDANPDWSPDGARIAFLTRRFAGGGYADIATMSPTGGTVTRISRTSAQFDALDWSPGGTMLAYSVPYCSIYPDACLGYNPGGDFTLEWLIFAMNADGSAAGIIGDGDAPEWQPGRSDPPRITDLPPVASFVYSCPSLRCSFTSTSTDDHGIVDHRWTFGDGTRDAGGAVSHGYAPPGGTYRVTLDVTDAEGHTASVSQNVTTGPDQPPVANFWWSCEVRDRTCFFNASWSSDDSRIVSYAWTFGDGSSASDSTVLHAYPADGGYEYDATLTVRDDAGQTSSLTRRVTIPDQAPIAKFTFTCGAARTCAFDSAPSTDDHGVVGWWWSFGDGSSLYDVPAASHAFPVDGTWWVSLTVRDSEWHTSTVTQAVTVADAPPVARFTWSCTVTACTFDGRASTDDYGIVSYAWGLGKYGLKNGSVVTVKVAGRQQFNAMLVVTDQAGQTKSITQTVTPR
jgi:dipeptidyl aminopeptidase/acylaminoacyl peptidase